MIIAPLLISNSFPDIAMFRSAFQERMIKLESKCPSFVGIPEEGLGKNIDVSQEYSYPRRIRIVCNGLRFAKAGGRAGRGTRHHIDSVPDRRWSFLRDCGLSLGEIYEFSGLGSMPS